MEQQRIDAKKLESIVFDILLKLKFSSEHAQIVAEHLVSAELHGHHSHGIIRLPNYHTCIRKGLINPQPNLTQESVSATIAFVDGDSGLGQIASHYAANLAIEKAKTAGLAAVGLHHVSHTGRLGAFVEQIASANMLGMYFCNGHSGLAMQAPYGGVGPKLATNPLALAAPRKTARPIVLDMATTAIAYGKVLLAQARGESLSEAHVLDHDGRPSKDPSAYFNGGTLLPFGGAQAYKGSGLALFVEIFAGLLSRARMLSKAKTQDHNGGFMLALNIEHFLPLELYFDEIEALCYDLKSARVREGFQEIFLPGERSNAQVVEQQKNGIKVGQKSWVDLGALAQQLGVNA